MFAAATTEGLLIYSLDRSVVFDPFNLDVDVTPEGIRERLDQQDLLTALLLALRLNEDKLTQEVVESIPYEEGMLSDMHYFLCSIFFLYYIMYQYSVLVVLLLVCALTFKLPGQDQHHRDFRPSIYTRLYFLFQFRFCVNLCLMFMWIKC
jgi:hypothetical protein